MDPILLARLQFALTVAFHFIFPAITIGLALLIALAATIAWRTGRPTWSRAVDFWTKLFAVSFAVGVASGIVMEFQFGTNWSRYAAFVGDIFGAPLAAEAVFAFFLESTFLGLLLFGRSRLSAGGRAFAAWMVALGSSLSAFWIIVADSWMQTPAGFEVIGDRAVLVDFWAAVFNPSTLPRYAHTLAACWTVGAFFMTGVAAWYVLRSRSLEVATASLKLGLVVAVAGSALMFVTGDAHARQVAHTQEAKFAAMNALYRTAEGVPLTVFALPPSQDPEHAPQGPEIQVARLLSFLAFGSFQAPIKGLDAFPVEDWAPIAPTFLAYHNMVILGTLMLLVMAGGLWVWWRGRLTSSRTWLRLAVLAIPLPLIAVQLGWVTAEVGRQPWIVYGLMRTAEAASPVVRAEELLLSIVVFGFLYLVLGALWLYVLVREIQHGPGGEGASATAAPAAGPSAGRAARRIVPRLVDTVGSRREGRHA